MRITNNFNRLYHGAFLKDLYEQMVQQKRILMSFKKFKDAIKYLNPKYPIDEKGDKISTTKISSKHLVEHIEFIIKWAGEYGITPKIIDDEWERLLAQANDYIE